MFSAAWAVEVGLISVRSFSKYHRAPLPSELMASFIVFGMIGLLAPASPSLAAALGWGIVLATLIGTQTDLLGPIGNWLSGGPPSSHDAPVNTDLGPLPGLGGGIPYGAPGYPDHP